MLIISPFIRTMVTHTPKPKYYHNFFCLDEFWGNLHGYCLLLETNKVNVHIYHLSPIIIHYQAQILKFRQALLCTYHYQVGLVGNYMYIALTMKLIVHSCNLLNNQLLSTRNQGLNQSHPYEIKHPKVLKENPQFSRKL